MDEIRVEFEFVRMTKNTHRYEEVTELDRPIMGTIYVQKTALEELGFPTTLVITLHNGDGTGTQVS